MADTQIAPTTPIAPPAAAQPATPAPASTPGAAAPKAEPVAAAKQPTAAEIRRLKLKLDGQDIELPEEEVIKLAQMSGAAQKRFQEAATARKQAEDVLTFLKANPKVAMEKLGIDVRKFSEETLTEIIKREQETPEAKKFREQDERLRKYEAKEKEETEAKQLADKQKQDADAKAKKDAELQVEIKKFDNLFTDALAKADVPKNSYTLQRMAHWTSVAIKSKQSPTADQIAKMVKKDYDDDAKSRVFAHKNDKGELDGDKIMEFLGDEGVKAIRKAMVAKLKTAKPVFSDPVKTTEAKPATQTQSRDAWREFSKKSRRSLT